MFIPKGHLKGFFIATGLLGVTVSAGVLASGSLGIFLKRNANEGYDPRVLDNTNQPDLTNGSGTMTDEKGTIWEYYNADDYASGHVSLNHEGYVGISSTTPWGIPGITSITVDYTPVTKGELWLLKSTNGTEWHEVQIIEDSNPVTWTDDWRFIRFYFWDDNDGHTNSVDIDSININYSCEHPEISATEAVDSALVDNVVSAGPSSTTSTATLTATKETSDISPNSDGGQAIKFTKDGSGGTQITIALNRTYKIGEVRHGKIEFDMKTANINYGKTVQLLGDSYTSGEISSNKHTSYKCTNLSGQWYHIEVPITAFGNFVSGYYTNTEHTQTKDKPASGLENKQFNRVKINAGACVIDNLRIGSNSCEIGSFNNEASFDNGTISWYKISWVGVLHSCTMTFVTDVPNVDNPDAPIVEQVSRDDSVLINRSPFYMRGLNTGTVTVTATVISGYNRQSHTTSKQFTVK